MRLWIEIASLAMTNDAIPKNNAASFVSTKEAPLVCRFYWKSFIAL